MKETGLSTFLSFHNYLDVCTTLCHSSRQRVCFGGGGGGLCRDGRFGEICLTKKKHEIYE